MNDTYGPTSQPPFAFYDPDSSCLRTSQATFLLDSMKSSVTLPRWGLMRSGALYERPTLVRPTDANGSSLLPTPQRADGMGGVSPNRERSPHDLKNIGYCLLPTPAVNDMGGGVYARGMGRVDGQDEGEAREWEWPRQVPIGRGAETLLPTPRSQNGEPRNMTAWERPLDQPQNLENALARVPAVQLLPTPTARDWKDTGDFTYRDKSILPHEIQKLGEQRWGIYAPAIARWEAVLGRPAPEPTDDKRRLNPDFVAWMMGFPENWLHGSRTQQLKQCGNAVVPQQGAYAIRALVSRFNAAEVL